MTTSKKISQKLKRFRRKYGFDIRDVYVLLVAIVAFILFIPLFTYIYFAQDIKSKDAIMNNNDTGVVLLDRNNKPFFTLFSGKAVQFVPISQIPNITQRAVVAAEDKNFYNEPGFSITGIIRAAFLDVKQGNLSNGGSTITQQLVKNSILTSEKNFLRKYEEIVLASEINRRYSKPAILEMYLNSVYFGKGGFGIEEAAKNYFGENAGQLTLAQSSYLAALLNAPSELSQPSEFSFAKQRQKYVLDQMVADGDITQQQADTAYKTPLQFSNSGSDINTIAPHFALMVRQWLINKYGEQQIAHSGYRVKTTLDLDWQKKAEQAVAQQVANLVPDNVSNGAAVAIDPKSGEIRALVGSVNWNNNQFGKVNMAITPRQPGSSFKPIIYGTAIEEGLITSATILQDVPTTFPGGYKPHDYDYKYRGPVTVRRALSNSLNIPAVEVMQKLGVAGGLAAAHNFGVTTIGNNPSDYGLSLVLGAGEVPLDEMTNVYATYADNGMQYPISIVEQIKDKQGNVVYTNHPVAHEVISPQAAYIITSILSDNKARAEEFGNLLTIPRTAAVKTGTTSNFIDSLTLGYTPSLAVGVWVGNNNNAPMDSVAGSLGAAPIWKQMMTEFLAGTPDQPFSIPQGVVKKTVCVNERIASHSATLTYTDYFIQGTEPNSSCSSSAIQITPLPTLSISPFNPPTVSPATQNNLPTDTSVSNNPLPGPKHAHGKK